MQWMRFQARAMSVQLPQQCLQAAQASICHHRSVFSSGQTVNPLIHDYDSLANYLKLQGIECPDALQISRAVASIRASRLPDPGHLGNAGSFFHNPVVDNVRAERLRETVFPQLPTYANGLDHCKLSAAWLIDNAGFKGLKQGGVGVYDKQALVLVNHGKGDGTQLLALAAEIQERVERDYGINLQIEPTII